MVDDLSSMYKAQSTVVGGCCASLNERGSHCFTYWNACSHLVELFGKDWKVCKLGGGGMLLGGL